MAEIVNEESITDELSAKRNQLSALHDALTQCAHLDDANGNRTEIDQKQKRVNVINSCKT